MKFYPLIPILNNKSLNLHESSIGKKIIRNIGILCNIILSITKNSKGEDIYELSLLELF